MECGVVTGICGHLDRVDLMDLGMCSTRFFWQVRSAICTRTPTASRRYALVELTDLTLEEAAVAFSTDCYLTLSRP